jgi:TonB family protein
MNEVWTKREGLIVDGVFPLRRCLSASANSAVFLTEYAASSVPDAALKLIRAVPSSAEAQLTRWRTAIALSHPHLMRLFGAGRCELGGLPYVYLVMEFAEQTLAQILPRRALTPEEVRDLLPPTLSALSFLQDKKLVQGRLKPSNFLVVADQLKLATDTIHSDGEAQGFVTERGAHEPPEASVSGYSSAGDVWGLGVTLVEALTQQLPTWKGRGRESVSLPTSLPAEFAQIVGRCLIADPANRAKLADLERWINPPPPPIAARAVSTAATPAPAVPPSVRPAPSPAPVVSRSMPRVAARSGALRPEPPQERVFGNSKRYAPLAAIAALVILAVAFWMLRHAAAPSSPAERSAPSAADVQTAKADAQSAARPDNGPPSVLHEELPEVPLRVREAVRGHLKVAVRVTVDGSGSVVDETLENRGPSKYFARLAMDAAKKWRFAPTNTPQPLHWVVRFEFTRNATAGHADGPKT